MYLFSYSYITWKTKRISETATCDLNSHEIISYDKYDVSFILPLRISCRNKSMKRKQITDIKIRPFREFVFIGNGLGIILNVVVRGEIKIVLQNEIRSVKVLVFLINSLT